MKILSLLLSILLIANSISWAAPIQTDTLRGMSADLEIAGDIQFERIFETGYAEPALQIIPGINNGEIKVVFISVDRTIAQSPATIETLDYLKQKGILISVFTKGQQGLGNAIKGVLDVCRASPEQAILFGDMERDMEAAKAAGISGFGIASELNRKASLMEAGAEWAFPNFQPLLGMLKLDKGMGGRLEFYPGDNVDLPDVLDFLNSDLVKVTTKSFHTARRYDPRAGGYINQPYEKYISKKKKPRYGPPMHEAIDIIKEFNDQLMDGDSENYEGDVIVIGDGIGGQAACSYQAVGVRNPFPNRKMVPLDRLNVNYTKLIKEWLTMLRTSKAGTDKGKLEELEKIKEAVRIMVIAGSKSGTTDETMANFQLCVSALIETYFRYVYGDDKGTTKANGMIKKIYNGRSWFDDDNDIIGRMNKTEKRIFSIVLKRTIFVTGEGDLEKKTGSRFDILGKIFAKKYDAKTFPVKTVWMAGNHGGRFQGGSPNGYAYNVAMGFDVEKQLESGSEVAQFQLESGNDNPSKKLAALITLFNPRKLCIAAPSRVAYGRTQEGKSQIAPESLGKGKIAGYAVGFQAYCTTTQEMVHALKYVKDEPGSRVYFIMSDNYMTKADIEAEQAIIKEQTARGNLVIRYKLREQDELELDKLRQFFEDFVMWYGMFSTLNAMLNKADSLELTDEAKKQVEDYYKKVGFTAADIRKVKYDPKRHSFRRIVSSGKAKDPQIQKEEVYLRWVADTYLPYLQPDVEAYKDFLKGENGAAFTMYNSGSKKFGDDDLPVRDEKERNKMFEDDLKDVEKGPAFVKESIHLRDENNNYGPGQITKEQLNNLPKFKNSMTMTDEDKVKILKVVNELFSLFVEEAQYKAAARQSTEEYRDKSDKAYAKIQEAMDRLYDLTKDISDFDDSAKETVVLMHHARINGKSVNMCINDNVDSELELIERFTRHFGIMDKLTKFPKEGHISYQQSFGGADIGLEIIALAIKTLDTVKKTGGRKIAYDGCTSKYLHGLYSYEIARALANSCQKGFIKRKVEFAMLKTKDLANSENRQGLIEFLIYLSRVKLYYEEMAKQQNEIKDPVDVSEKISTAA
ncbi:MAG: hypothetical protein V2A72_02090 [Candidatus Omnitrophota bacterium]